jgi:hypothetical protein
MLTLLFLLTQVYMILHLVMMAHSMSDNVVLGGSSIFIVLG